MLNRSASGRRRPGAEPAKVSEDVRAEISRRQSHVEALREFFMAHPNEWINAVELERYGGRQAWRTRVSDLRKLLKAADAGTIENRVQHPKHQIVRDADAMPSALFLDSSPVISEYRYVPFVRLGRDASEPTPRTWTTDGPFTDDFKLTP